MSFKACGFNIRAGILQKAESLLLVDPIGNEHTQCCKKANRNSYSPDAIEMGDEQKRQTTKQQNERK